MLIDEINTKLETQTDALQCSPFKVGDVVALKSEGSSSDPKHIIQEMTVNDVSIDGTKIKCDWFRNGTAEFHREEFPFESLLKRRIEPGAPFPC